MVALEMRGLFYRQFPSVTSDVSLARVARVSFRDDSRTVVNWVQPFANNLPSWISRVSKIARQTTIDNDPDRTVPRARPARKDPTHENMQSIATSNKIAPASQGVRPTSAKANRRATAIVPRATKDSKGSDEEESTAWKKWFLADGNKEEVKSEDYQKFQAEMAAKKAANKEKAAAKEGGCTIM